MFPYPSGKLHMGHVRNYTINDVLTRWHLRMKGCNVLHADGLGRLRAAGRERGDEEQGAAGAVDLRQHRLHEGARCRRMGLAIDWAREVATCKPDYYQLEPVAVPEDARGGHRRATARRSSTGTRWTRRCWPTSR
jgi:leucyl-tRNA synthetase